MEYSSSLVHRSRATVGWVRWYYVRVDQEPEIAEYEGEITKIDTDRSQLITHLTLNISNAGNRYHNSLIPSSIYFSSDRGGGNETTSPNQRIGMERCKFHKYFR